MKKYNTSPRSHDYPAAGLTVVDTSVRVIHINGADYISMTDLAKHGSKTDPSDVIRNWMSNKNSLEFYGLWEELNNPNFNSVDFHGIKTTEAPYNRFTMTPTRWHRDFSAIGIIPSAGKYSKGTYAHLDIAFEFASWLSPEFKMYLIKEFERLKADESYRRAVEWQAGRILAKVNYLIHTDAIKENIIPTLSAEQKNSVYAEEADIINVALFGMTAKEWRKQHPELSKKGNLRDYASLLQLVILSNLENINAELIRSKISPRDRLVRLNEIANKQFSILQKNGGLDELKLLQ